MTRSTCRPEDLTLLKFRPITLDDAYFYGARSRALEGNLPPSMALIEQYTQEARDTVQSLINLHYDRTDPGSGSLPALLRYFYPEIDLSQANVTVTIHADPSPWTVLDRDPEQAVQLLLSALRWPEQAAGEAEFLLEYYAHAN